jgi:hypothetical protein
LREKKMGKRDVQVLEINDKVRYEVYRLNPKRTEKKGNWIAITRIEGVLDQSTILIPPEEFEAFKALLAKPVPENPRF